MEPAFLGFLISGNISHSLLTVVMPFLVQVCYIKENYLHTILHFLLLVLLTKIQQLF